MYFSIRLRDQFGNVAGCSPESRNSLAIKGIPTSNASWPYFGIDVGMPLSQYEIRCDPGDFNTMVVAYRTTVSGSYMANVTVSERFPLDTPSNRSIYPCVTVATQG